MYSRLLWTCEPNIAMHAAGNLQFHFKNSQRLLFPLGKLCSWRDRLRSQRGQTWSLAGFMITRTSLVILRLSASSSISKEYTFLFRNTVKVTVLVLLVSVNGRVLILSCSTLHSCKAARRLSHTEPTRTVLSDAHHSLQNYHYACRCRLCLSYALHKKMHCQPSLSVQLIYFKMHSLDLVTLCRSGWRRTKPAHTLYSQSLATLSNDGASCTVYLLWPPQGATTSKLHTCHHTGSVRICSKKKKKRGQKKLNVMMCADMTSCPFVIPLSVAYSSGWKR